MPNQHSELNPEIPLGTFGVHLLLVISVWVLSTMAVVKEGVKDLFNHPEAFVVEALMMPPNIRVTVT